ncbi:succinylglutamate desuccinylase/aspartoacylase family protein [Vibrio breoganii]|uniref:succinylglutamate desuccinylase/aspartoacylase family protein n=1 Tax=Vibrio breoganii TaxID=553239 RepID=UPI000C8367D9|nr:succinylglutamate desuccinylase/aspartoacylase family protein [Vibrio breoganii]PMJ49803.1 succinylglutamate desuccinylase [Vibrio breoganii]PMK54760.1 succinylglutamate desuccinylase [Vibrio breoganii]PMO27593.1 succinylglutamate desuccinylase [Vibrio breoganii]PMO35115.1 succinylglutamate desuccinylase [Vibrio breoganii]PMO63869.1 succinylglutamate desuccinylase [Vibrio breoganii]
MSKALTIAGVDILPGEQCQIDVPVAKLYTDTELSLPVHIQRGKRQGPTVFVSAAVHGDELNGIEIIRRLISANLNVIRGTLILVPMVNVYGVLNQSRYLPDRRDLNRSFPGSEKGSMAARLAHTLMENIVKHCDYGIDLHTGAIHRSNLPQIRADLSDAETKDLAETFGVPVLLNSVLRDGSLREAATSNNTRILLYEAGEALRFDDLSINAGYQGVQNVLMKLGLIRKRRVKRKIEPFIANKSEWLRASGSGFVNEMFELGEQVIKGQTLAEIHSPLGELIQKVVSTRSGIIIGKQNIPLVQEGDAMYHIAYFGQNDDGVAVHIELLQDTLGESDNG